MNCTRIIILKKNHLAPRFSHVICPHHWGFVINVSQFHWYRIFSQFGGEEIVVVVVVVVVVVEVVVVVVVVVVVEAVVAV